MNIEWIKQYFLWGLVFLVISIFLVLLYWIYVWIKNKLRSKKNDSR